MLSTVYSSATATGTVVNGSGFELVGSGGTAVGTVVNSGGFGARQLRQHDRHDGKQRWLGGCLRRWRGECHDDRSVRNARPPERRSGIRWDPVQRI